MAAPSSQQIDRVFRFGPFELSEREGELRKNGVRIKLQEQPFRVLVELLASAGKLVSREELQQKLWPADTFVDFDDGLNTAIRKLRQTLNDDADHPHYIETLAKRGYRFIGPVSGPTTITPAPAPRPTKPWKRWRSVFVAGAAIAAVGVTYWWVKPFVERQVRITELQKLSVVPLTALPGRVGSPTFSPDGSQVAFAWDGENNGAGYDLYVKTIGADRPLRITTHPASQLSAAWSPDGRNIAISRVVGVEDSGIHLVPPTGGPEKKISSRVNFSQNSVALSWSPDGKEIAFTDHPERASWERELQLFTLSLETLERTQINTGCTLVVSPAFSPRGDLLAWACVDSWSGSVASFKSRQGCCRASVVRSQAANSKRLSMNRICRRRSSPATHRACPFRIM
jgi:DNA-binding winged helix-turn-helix (wHTH) protein